MRLTRWQDQLAWVGLGAMGKRMATNLAKHLQEEGQVSVYLITLTSFRASRAQLANHARADTDAAASDRLQPGRRTPERLLRVCSVQGGRVERVQGREGSKGDRQVVSCCIDLQIGREYST